MHYFLKQAVVQTGDVNMRKEELHVPDFCGCQETCENVDPPIGEIGADEEEESDEQYIFNI